MKLRLKCPSCQNDRTEAFRLHCPIGDNHIIKDRLTCGWVRCMRCRGIIYVKRGSFIPEMKDDRRGLDR